jgi:guanosine-3',5'-bis(diphosphate) 3'-pyrophosphohydrolase
VNPPLPECFSAEDILLLFRALRFSADKHRDQRRKDSRASPYINHPIEVAELLWRVGQVHDVVAIAGALLHDTIEDTETTADEIAACFSRQIAELVLEVSDDKTLPKAERKRNQILHAPHISRRAQWVKLADKICNVYDITHSPPRDWPLQRRREYLDWTEQVVAGLRGCNPALEAYYDEILRDGRGHLHA